MAMFDSLRDKITILTAKYFLEGFRGKKDVNYNGESDTLYLFSRECKFAGMAHWTGHILVNELLFDEGNERLLDYIYLHEKGHQRSFIPKSLLGGIAQFIVSPFMLLVHLAVVLSALGTFMGNVGLSPVAGIENIVIGADLLVVIISVIVSYIGELNAEIYAKRILGQEEFLEAYNRLEDQLPDRNLLQRISFLLTHPIPELVLKVDNSVVGMKNSR